MHYYKAVLGFTLSAAPLVLNAAETTNNVSSEIRSVIRENMARSCIAGRPPMVQTEAQIQAHIEFCECTAEFTSQNIKDEDAVEIEKDVAEYEHGKKSMIY